MLASYVPGLLTALSGRAPDLWPLAAAALIGLGPPGQEPVACELVDPASAEMVLGSDATNLGGAAVPGVCRYDKADASLILVVQIFGAPMYDVMPINPETPVDIGDRGRYGVGASGSANVQFVQGAFSVTIRVSPSHRSGPSASPLVEQLLEVARLAASRLPPE